MVITQVVREMTIYLIGSNYRMKSGRQFVNLYGVPCNQPGKALALIGWGNQFALGNWELGSHDEKWKGGRTVNMGSETTFILRIESG